jgi:hypothetical protein
MTEGIIVYIDARKIAGVSARCLDSIEMISFSRMVIFGLGVPVSEFRKFRRNIDAYHT